MVKVNNKDTISHVDLVFLLLTLNKQIPVGKMLMVPKVQDDFHHIFCFDSEKGLGNSGKSQDYLVSCPTVNLIYLLRF